MTTGLVLTVRDAAEVDVAMAAGPNILDIKDPAAGSLGRPQANTVRQIIRRVGGRIPLSVADGELAWGPTLDFDELPPLLRYAKIGLSDCQDVPAWKSQWRTWKQSLATAIVPVAVVYADWIAARTPAPHEIIHTASQLGFGGLLVDTCRKSQGPLFAVVDVEEIKSWMRAADRLGLWTALAGSLTSCTIPEALALRPRFVAIRSAACAGGRAGNLDFDRSRAIAEQIRGESTNTPT